MTAYNKRLIINSCLLLERKYGRKHLSFITLTLPSECASGSSALYGEAKRQMLQWLHRRLSTSLLPTQVIGCTELQGSRFDESGAFALHEHWVCVGRQPYTSWSIKAKELQSAWIRILSNVYQLGRAPEFSRSACRIESIRKSASAYLGKYMGKSEKVVDRAIEAGLEECLPASWVTRTLEMLAMFRHSIVSLNGKDGIAFMDIVRKMRSTFTRWNKDLTCVLSNGSTAWIAFIGYLNQDGKRLLALIRTGQSPGFQLECS